MKMRTKIMVISGIASATLLGGGLITQQVFAQGNGTVSSLVSELAQKFNLKPADVQAVFDEHQQEVRADRQQRYADRLTQAVTDGKLTQAQKDLILAKQLETQEKLTDLRNTQDKNERRSKMQQIQSDLKTWAQTNNIDPQWLRPELGPGKGMMMDRGKMGHPPVE
jgi:hypothetical protein